MADTCRQIEVSGTANFDHRDNVTVTYRCEYDSVPTNYYSALIRAQTAGGSPVPLRRSRYLGTTLTRIFCLSINGKPESIQNHRAVWLWTASFGPPPKNDGKGEQTEEENPLLRPPVFNVDYIDREEVIEKARNVEQLAHGDGKGGNRAADTEGPIVNAAGKRPDEPLVDTNRQEVLVIEKNYPTLASIVTLNRFYKKTTNSDAVQGYDARQLRYLLTRSRGKQFENGVEYWPGITTILADDTTDLQIDNVGYDYWDNAEGDWVQATRLDSDGIEVPAAEPINLKLDGDKGGDNSTTITYRYLTEESYAGLFI